MSRFDRFMVHVDIGTDEKLASLPAYTEWFWPSPALRRLSFGSPFFIHGRRV